MFQLSFDGFDPPPLPPARRKATGDAVFLAVLPDERAAGSIVALATALSHEYRLHGQPTPVDLLHISLLGVRVPRESAEEVAETINASAWIGDPVFDVAFDRVMSFKNRSGSKPLVLTGESEGLARLEKRASWALRDAGIKATIGGVFTPHVTMLYDPETVLPRPVEPIGWRVREVVLLHSLRGQGRHRVLHRWELRG